MTPSKRKKRRKKVRYHTIKLKLTTAQRKSLVNYCEARQTTPTKLIKKMIRPFIQKYSKEVPEELYVTENQLELFEQDTNHP
jgi:hypothetical protein